MELICRARNKETAIAHNANDRSSKIRKQVRQLLKRCIDDRAFFKALDCKTDDLIVGKSQDVSRPLQRDAPQDNFTNFQFR